VIAALVDKAPVPITTSSCNSADNAESYTSLKGFVSFNCNALGYEFIKGKYTSASLVNCVIDETLHPAYIAPDIATNHNDFSTISQRFLNDFSTTVLANW